MILKTLFSMSFIWSFQKLCSSEKTPRNLIEEGTLFYFFLLISNKIDFKGKS